MLLSKKSRNILVSCHNVCFGGDYAALQNHKYNGKQSLSELSPYNPVPVSSEKVHELGEQHRYIKHDVPNYKPPQLSTAVFKSRDHCFSWCK